MNIVNWIIASLVIVAAVVGIVFGIKYAIKRYNDDGFDFDEDDMDVLYYQTSKTIIYLGK